MGCIKEAEGGWRRSNIFTWSSCVIHGLILLHDTSAPPLTSFPLTSLKLQYW